MTAVEKKVSKDRLDEKLATRGLRFTPQRERVYAVLMEERDHPTAEQVFIRAKKEMPEISMATVYNCLDALVSSGLVKLVNVERGASRFCPNMHEHFHFQCEGCGAIFDIDHEKARPQIPLPRGFRGTHFEISVRGFCPDCAVKRKV
jgi:Fur family peroxide stress response transcriptional regulator